MAANRSSAQESASTDIPNILVSLRGFCRAPARSVPDRPRDAAVIGERRSAETFDAASPSSPAGPRESCGLERGDPSCRGSRGSTRNPPRSPERSSNAVPPVHSRWRTSCGVPTARNCSWSRCCYPAGTRCASAAR